MLQVHNEHQQGCSRGADKCSQSWAGAGWESDELEGLTEICLFSA